METSAEHTAVHKNCKTHIKVWSMHTKAPGTGTCGTMLSLTMILMWRFRFILSVKELMRHQRFILDYLEGASVDTFDTVNLPESKQDLILCLF